LPESGFWTKIAFQKDVTILPLMEFPEIPNIVNLHGQIEVNGSETTSFTKFKKLVEIEMGEKVQVPKLIKNWHPLVASFRDRYIVYQKEMQKGNWSHALNIILPDSWTRGLVKKSLNLTKRYDQTNPTQIHA
jgi:hypothetical protein